MGLQPILIKKFVINVTNRLKQADDAVLVDSSEMGIDDVVNAILNVYKEKMQK